VRGDDGDQDLAAPPSEHEDDPDQDLGAPSRRKRRAAAVGLEDANAASNQANKAGKKDQVDSPSHAKVQAKNTTAVDWIRLGLLPSVTYDEALLKGCPHFTNSEALKAKVRFFAVFLRAFCLPAC
jgi:hypothetical protein